MLPVQQQERAQILDVLRGIAILGILLNNIYSFSGYGPLPEEAKQQLNTYYVDRILNFLQIVLVEGKFYSLFSLLFGIGFSIIIIRNQQKGINGLTIFYRRLLVLLLIGAAHIYFLWEGDILFLYAVIGLLLPLFRNCSNRTLLTWAVVLILSPIAYDIIKLWLQGAPGDSLQHFAEGIDERNGIVGEQWRTYLYTNDSGWHEWRNYQNTAFMYRFSGFLDNNRIPKVLGMFLLGFYAGRNMIYINLSQYKSLLKKLMMWGFLIGIPFSIAMAYFEGDGKSIYKSEWGMADTISYAFGVVPLSLAYVSVICLFWLKTKGETLTLFAGVGRMALTNYLIQSIIGVALFYGVGFGFGQRFGLVYLFATVLIIYIIQIFYSHFWFRYFQYGPMEWLWRQLTYAKRFPLRKVK